MKYQASIETQPEADTIYGNNYGWTTYTPGTTPGYSLQTDFMQTHFVLPEEIINDFEVSYDVIEDGDKLTISFKAQKLKKIEENNPFSGISIFKTSHDFSVPIFVNTVCLDKEEFSAIKKGDEKVISMMTKKSLEGIKRSIIEWKVDNDEKCLSLNRVIGLMD